MTITEHEDRRIQKVLEGCTTYGDVVGALLADAKRRGLKPSQYRETNTPLGKLKARAIRYFQKVQDKHQFCGERLAFQKDCIDLAKVADSEAAIHVVFDGGTTRFFAVPRKRRTAMKAELEKMGFSVSVYHDYAEEIAWTISGWEDDVHRFLGWIDLDDDRLNNGDAPIDHFAAKHGGKYTGS
jgi:hypothetical protein